MKYHKVKQDNKQHGANSLGKPSGKQASHNRPTPDKRGTTARKLQKSLQDGQHTPHGQRPRKASNASQRNEHKPNGKR